MTVPKDEAVRMEPPSLPPQSLVRRNMLAAVAAPGEWWLITTYPSLGTARRIASHYRTRKAGRKPPVDGQWEFRHGPVDDRPGEFGLWARYIGPNQEPLR